MVLFKNERNFDWRMQIYSCNGYSILQILNQHHLEKKGFICEQNQRKKDEKVALRISHLEPRSIQEEDKNKLKCKTKDVDNHVDYPQDCSGVSSGLAKEDSDDNNSSLPVGSKLSKRGFGRSYGY